jgi:hypothetical protein
MPITLCVSLWPLPGKEADLAYYEDVVLALLPDHDGRLVVRARAAAFDPTDSKAYEMQVIEFASPAGLAAYMDDERRTTLAHLRDAAIARTELQYVDLV